MLEIFNELWNYISYLFNKINNDINFIESLNKLVKIYIQGLDKKFIPFIKLYAKIIINNYKSNPQSSYLFALEVIIYDGDVPTK